MSIAVVCLKSPHEDINFARSKHVFYVSLVQIIKFNRNVTQKKAADMLSVYVDAMRKNKLKNK